MAERFTEENAKVLQALVYNYLHKNGLEMQDFTVQYNDKRFELWAKVELTTPPEGEKGNV